MHPVLLVLCPACFWYRELPLRVEYPVQYVTVAPVNWGTGSISIAWFASVVGQM